METLSAHTSHTSHITHITHLHTSHFFTLHTSHFTLHFFLALFSTSAAHHCSAHASYTQIVSISSHLIRLISQHRSPTHPLQTRRHPLGRLFLLFLSSFLLFTSAFGLLFLFLLLPASAACVIPFIYPLAQTHPLFPHDPHYLTPFSVSRQA